MKIEDPEHKRTIDWVVLVLTPPESMFRSPILATTMPVATNAWFDRDNLIVVVL